MGKTISIQRPAPGTTYVSGNRLHRYDTGGPITAEKLATSTSIHGDKEFYGRFDHFTDIPTDQDSGAKALQVLNALNAATVPFYAEFVAKRAAFPAHWEISVPEDNQEQAKTAMEPFGQPDEDEFEQGEELGQMGGGIDIEKLRKDEAKKDIALLKKESSTAITNTIHGVLWLQLKDGVYEINNGHGTELYKGDEDGATRFVANAYIIEDEQSNKLAAGGLAAERKYTSIAPAGTRFLKVGSHRAMDKIIRTGIPYISFYNLYAHRTAGESLILIYDKDYEKLGDIKKSLSEPPTKITSKGMAWSARAGTEGEENEAESDKLRQLYDESNPIELADGGPIGTGKNSYKAFFHGKNIEVNADTSYGAQKTAAQHFKARHEGDVNVWLMAVDGEQVTHVADFGSGGTAIKYESFRKIFPNEFGSFTSVLVVVLGEDAAEFQVQTKVRQRQPDGTYVVQAKDKTLPKEKFAEFVNDLNERAKGKK